MRLTCPNCDAQYEVPDEVIPTAGRDVQCSNCGQTWFQHHPDHAPEEEEMIEATQAPDPDEEVAPPPPPSPSAKTPKQRELDPAVADILRQEAEAEFEARKRRQSETLESQPDLGLETSEDRAPLREGDSSGDDDAERRAAEARKRMARMRGEPVTAAAAAAGLSSRRELLPDIDEINSTLRSDDTPSGLDADAREELGAGGQKKEKRGFRSGFRTVVLIAIVLALLYVLAPRITAAVPALEGVMSAYVGAIDQARVALDGPLRSLLGWLDEAASESGN